METAKQLMREFWLPFLIALAWTFYHAYSVVGDRSFATEVQIFSGAFFLASWASGQVHRVNRQAKTERGIKDVETKVFELTGNLDAAAKKLVATITGGDSVAYANLEHMGGGRFRLVFIHKGDYPLTDVALRIFDSSGANRENYARGPFGYDIHLNLGQMAPNTAYPKGTILQAVGDQDWNFFFSARNGHWSQAVRVRNVGSDWIIATTVHGVGHGIDPVVVHIPSNFPNIGEPEFDDAARPTSIV